MYHTLHKIMNRGSICSISVLRINLPHLGKIWNNLIYIWACTEILFLSLQWYINNLLWQHCVILHLNTIVNNLKWLKLCWRVFRVYVNSMSFYTRDLNTCRFRKVQDVLDPIFHEIWFDYIYSLPKLSPYFNENTEAITFASVV